MESMLEILNQCLKESNLETVSKAELRKKYLAKTGLPKLSHEDKKLFISAVNTAYLNYIENKTTTEIEKDSTDEVKEDDEGWKLTISSSDDDNTPQNIKEKYDQVINDKNTKKIGDEVKKNCKPEKLEMDSTLDNISPGNIQENVLDHQFVNGANDVEMDSSNDFDEKCLAAITNAYKKLSGKRTLVSSSEDEAVQLKSTKKKKIKKSSDLEVQPATQSEEKKVFTGINNKAQLKSAMVKSSDSEEEPLSVYQKKSKEEKEVPMSIKNKARFKNAIVESSDSEEEPLSVFQKKPKEEKKVSISIKNKGHLKKAMVDSSDSEEEPLSVFKKKPKEEKKVSMSIKNKGNLKKAALESGDSEEEPLSVFQKNSNSGESFNSIAKLNEPENESFRSTTKKSNKCIDDSENYSSDSEAKPLVKFQKSNDSSRSNGKRKEFKTKHDSNNFHKSIKSKNSFSDSEDEPLIKYDASSSNREKLYSSNKFTKSFGSSSESEDQFLTKNSKQKTTNSNDLGEKQLLNSTKKIDSLNSSFKSVKDSSDSEDKPLHTLSNKKDIFSVSKKKLVEKTVRSKVKRSLKKKRIYESDGDANISSQKKEDSLPSDSCEDEPLSNMKKKQNKFTTSFESTSESEDESLSKNLKQMNNFIDSGEERPIHSTKKTDALKLVKNSSDSEDEPLHSLSNKKKDNSFTSKDLPSKKTVKRKIKQSSKKKIIVASDDDDANLSNQKKDNSLLSDSCEDEPLSNIKKEANNSSDSDVPLNKLSAKNSDKKRKNSESGSSSFVDENEEQSINKNKLSKKKEANDAGKGKKRPSASENKIEHLKKYLRVAGIRIKNYNKLFENCKSTKAKCEKMMSLLEKEGLEGRPTLEKCKKLRVKIETKREIAELDVSNILRVEGGRPKRGICSDTTNHKQEEKSSPMKRFSRLQDIVDSEESD